MKYGEIEHSSHRHTLESKKTKRLYTCDGCKEHGFNVAYRCDGCNYDLHKECALARPSISHPFFDGCTFAFLESPPGAGERVCDACGRDIRGFVYHCRNKGWDLHPCCANLPRVIRADDHQTQLHLRRKVYSRCSHCGIKKLHKRVGGWSYVSTCDQFHFHVACVKDIMVEGWEDYFEDDGEIKDSDLALINPRWELVPCDSGGTARKYRKIAEVVIRCLISVFLGDPVGMVIELVANLLRPE